MSRAWKTLISIGSISCSVLAAPVAIAAETVVLKYNILRETFAVSELRALADTGEPSPKLKTYLRLANQNPAKVQETLNEPIEAKATTLDKNLNNPIGEVVLDEVGQYIHTPSRRANREAMRSALIASATPDDNVRLIEVLENYPTDEVHVDGDRLVATYRRLRDLQGGLRNLLEQLPF